jgi:hypothetical protein
MTQTQWAVFVGEVAGVGLFGLLAGMALGRWMNRRG